MDKLLIVLAVVLGVIAIAQLAKSYELAATLRNKREEDVSRADIKINGGLMLLFMAAFYIFLGWQIWAYSDVFLPEAASVHGQSIDTLFDVNLIIIFIAFLLTNTLLFWFAYKYQHRPERKALFYPHNNKLELIWTVIPAIVLAAIIIYGLKTWNTITAPPSDDAEQIELYAEQFKWTIRYSGEDGKLGKADYNLIAPAKGNALGIITPAAADVSIEEVEASINAEEKKLMNNEFYIMMEEKYHEIEKMSFPLKPEAHGEEHGHDDHHGNHHHAEHNELRDRMAHMTGYDIPEFHVHNESDAANALEMLDNKMDAVKDGILLDSEVDEITAKVKRLELHKRRLIQIKNMLYNNKDAYKDGNDDVLVNGEFHIPVGKEVVFKMRSKDVIHSAYLPHFRTQMNAVPGMTTSFKMTPNKTTSEMKAIEGDDFEFILLCNKICGASHYNMQAKIIVESEEDYKAWLKQQKTFNTVFADANKE